MYTEATYHIDSTNQVLVFDTDGYYASGDPNWQDVIYTATMTYKGGTIGISPRIYEDNMYISLLIENKSILDESTGETKTSAYASLDAQVTYDSIHLGSKVLPALVIDTVYVFKTMITGTNYKIYLNDTLIFNIEYASMSRGKVGAYGSAGNHLKDMQVEALFPDGWTTNASDIPSAIATVQEFDNEDSYIYMENPASATSSLIVEQLVDIVGGQTYTASYDYEGDVRFYAGESDGASPQIHKDDVVNSSAMWARGEFGPFTVSTDCTKIAVRMVVDPGSSVSINNLQIEPNDFATGYIHNESTVDAAVREDSLITFPSKNNINQANGSVSLWVKPSITYDGTSLRPVLFEYGDENGRIAISFNGSGITFTYGNEQISYGTSFIEEQWYHIVGTWTGSSGLGLYVDNQQTLKNTTDTLNNNTELIRIGHGYLGSDTVFHGAIDETIVYGSALNRTMVDSLFTSTEPLESNEGILMRATFNHAIGNFNKSAIEMTPAPQYGSPVVTEKQDGTPLQKVSFFDVETGEYRTYNEEHVYYDGKADYVTVSYENIDEENFKITIRDLENIQYGTPYYVDGKRIYLSLSDAEKTDLAGKMLVVSYQLENSFTVDYNIDSPDSFRINIGKYDGEPVKVHYEGNDFYQEKLATMIELNPLLNPNHEGFLYITNNTERVTSYRAKATPGDLPANGVSEAMVVIEPMDASGNFISHLNLKVQADKGTVIPAYDKGSILLRDRAGRYIYKYTAPFLHFNQENKLEVTDRVNIIDKETGLGVQIPITLTTLTTVSHVIDQGETLESISNDYGVSQEDISIENSKTVEEMEQYILNNAGQGIRIPMNYSSTLYRKTKEEMAEEPMIAALLSYVLEYMNQKTSNLPSGLASILDFNQDKMISIDEVVWLTDNKGSGNIQEKYASLKDWEKNHAG